MESLGGEVETMYLDLGIDHSFSLPLSLFNLMSQLDLLDILMSQVLPHGLTQEISKESYYVVFHHILSSGYLTQQQGSNNEESSSPFANSRITTS